MTKERILEEAIYMIAHTATVRNTASKFQVSKSTVHKDVTERLESINPELHQRVMRVLSYNKQMRASRGGRATREMWRAKNAKKNT